MFLLYGKKAVPESDDPRMVTYNGISYPILGCSCRVCGYVFFFPMKREHEPTYCPNCRIRFVALNWEGDDPIPIGNSE